MRRHLLASTALIAVSISAHAETISTKRTTPVQTSAVKAGAPDAIVIAAQGSVEITGGNAVTMDSNHAVTNAGKIIVNNGSNANGGGAIVANAGTSAAIDNSGTITVEEPYAPSDADNDGDLDGPFAVGSGRYGIRTLGDHVGKISNSGTITVEGNESAGISLGGKLIGGFTHDGKTTVIGDRSVGIDARQVDGNVRLAGTVSAQGKDAIGARFAGDVSGSMVVQGMVLSTGYRSVAAPADASKLDVDDLLQGGSALLIEGSVTGGVVFAAAPKDNDPNKADEDGDGIEDAKEGTAKVVSHGSAAAVAIGATDRAITLDPVPGTASRYGLQIEGSIEGQGVYGGVDANGLVVGGRGGAVMVANGIGLSGTVSAASNGSNATALRIGSGASTPELRNAGTISASGSSAAGKTAQAVVVDAGGGLAAIRNSGTIKATAGDAGSAVGIVDRSGGLRLIETSGSISATGARADSGRNVAIDLSANTSGTTIRQTVVAAGISAPSITGDVLLGSGNDTVDLADGMLKGTIGFGAGNNTFTLSGDATQAGNVAFGNGNDTISLSGTSRFDGVANFGGGVDALTLSGSSIFVGSLVNAANLNVTLNGGTLNIAKPTTIGSLTVGSGSVLVATLDKAAGEGTAYTVAGTASFAQGSKLSLRLANLSTAVGRYTVLTAGTLQGASNLTTDTLLVPFLFKASIVDAAGANSISVDVARRTVTELGLKGSEAIAYDAVFAALGKDKAVENLFLGVTDGGVFREAVAAMLPDHAGGAFEGVSTGVRTLTRQMLDPRGPIAQTGDFGVFVNTGFWGSDKKRGESADYNLNGYTWSLMGEYRTRIGTFSASAAWLWNQHLRGAGDVSSNSYELAGGWHNSWGGISAFGRGSIGTSDFSGKRMFTGSVDGKPVEKSIRGDWNGSFVSLAGGISGEGGGSRFFFRPAVTVDYVRLTEKAYADKGGGAGLDLVVDGRKSDELGVNAGLTLGIDFYGNRKGDENWLRLEAESGRREIVSGGLGDTTAHFKDGIPFTLHGDGSTSGWFGRLRMFGGMSGFTMGGEMSAEQRHEDVALTLRGTIRIGF